MRHKIDVRLPDVTIPPAAIKSVTLESCELNVTPPKCKKVILDYEKGSEIIVVKPKQ